LRILAVDAWKGGTEDVVVVVGDQPFVDGSPGDYDDSMASPSLIAELYHVGDNSFSPAHGSPRTSHASEVTPDPNP